MDISECVVTLYEAANVLLDEAGGPGRPLLQLTVEVRHATLEVLKPNPHVVVKEEPTRIEVL